MSTPKKSLFTDTEYYTTKAHNIELEIIEFMTSIFNKYSEYKTRELEYIAKVAVDTATCESLLQINVGEH